jgi:hypothetical protein
MKLGSETFDEEQEKAEFFRVKSLLNKISKKTRNLSFCFVLQNLEQTKGENKIDYGILNHEIEFDLSPTRNGTGNKKFL